MRGWLVINPTDKPQVIIGGHKGTYVSDVDLKLVTHSTDVLGPYLRLKASFRMNGVSASDASIISICALIYAGQENPTEHDVYFDFDFDFDAVQSFQRIPDAQTSDERHRMKQLLETFATPQKRGRWVLRVQYPCESVRSTGFEQAMSKAKPAQKAILMGLAQLLEVGEFIIHMRGVAGVRRMVERWEGFMEKRKRDAAHVSLPPCAHIRLRAQLTYEIVESHEECLHGRYPPQTMIPK